MANNVVDREEFHRILRTTLTERFRRSVADGPADESQDGEFTQLKTSVEFFVSARKKKPAEPDPDPEPCCVCFRSGQGIVCSGDCCVEVIFPDA